MQVKPGDEVDSRAHYPTSHAGLKEAGLIEVSEDSKPPLMWIDGTITMKTAESLLPYQRANKIPCMDYICFKSTLFSEVNIIKKQYPSVFNFYTDTYVLPHDYPEFQRRHTFICSRKSQAPTWVIKPKNGCCGKGIQLINSIYEAEGITDQSVAQLYIHPYLLDNLKFDFRFFVLISTLEPFTVFIYNEGIARFCTEPYQPPNKANKTHAFAHLTNTAINKTSKKNAEDFTKRATETMKRFGSNEKTIWNSIKRATGLFLAGIYPTIIACLPKKDKKIPQPTSFFLRPKEIQTYKSHHVSPSRSFTSLSNAQGKAEQKTARGERKKAMHEHMEEETCDCEEGENQQTKEAKEENVEKQEKPEESEKVEDEKKEAEDEIPLKDVVMPIEKKFFHILGIDVMIDEQMNPQILELNDRPSLSVTVPFEMELKTAMIRDAFKHISHDGSYIGEVEGSGWQQVLPAPPGTELDTYSKIAMERKSTIKYTGRAAGDSPVTNRMIQSGINEKLHQERRERYEDLKQSMKMPKFQNFSRILL